MKNAFQRLAPAMALCLPLLATAQQASSPADAKAAGQPLRYQSAFSDYKPWQDIKPGDWRQLNDSVAPKDGKSGGHAGHGAAPASAPAAPAAKASAPAAPAAETHQGQHMHGGKQ
jgi:hypothetical protein